MARRRNQPQLYLEKKTGVFSRFFTPTSIVIECILTSFDIHELKWLSYAKEVTSRRDFDLLIQRDIDVSRAKKDISEYIVSSARTAKKPMFLPPLIAAVVPVDDKKNIKEYYPKSEFKEDEDEVGKFYHRTWAPYFQVTFYDNDEGGLRLFMDTNDSGPKENPLVSSSQVDIGVTLSRTPGAKLVIIDGQHRLFALNSLKEQEQYSDAVKDLLIPVLIVYAPNSEEGSEPMVPSVPDVFRTLFVDVNDNAHKVSGHFVILLSDNTLGSVICRSFCEQVLNDYGPEGLSQIEWNTRNDKESKTISKDFTLTSIGVIDELLHSVFKQFKHQDLLRYMLNLEQGNFDFGQDDAGNSKPEPKGFPWQSFSYEHKKKLREHVQKYVVPCLIEIFFNSKQYGAVKKVFDQVCEQVIQNEINDRSSEYQSAATMVNKYLLENIPYVGPDSQDLMKRFNMRFIELSEGQYSSIVRNNVYQKGMLAAWIEVQHIGKRLNLAPIDTTKGFVVLLDESFKSKLFINDDKHSYLQDSIYDGIRIRPTVACRHQVCRLTLALLGKQSVRKKVMKTVKDLDNGLDGQDFEERLETLGVKSVAQFLGGLKKERISRFTRSFRADISLSEGVREKLIKLYDEKETAKREKRTDRHVVIPDDFDRLVEECIEDRFAIAQTQLEGITRFYAAGESEIEDDEED